MPAHTTHPDNSRPDNVIHLSDYLRVHLDDSGDPPRVWTAEPGGPWQPASLKKSVDQTRYHYYVSHEGADPMSNHLIIAADDLYPNQHGSTINAVAINITPELVQELGLAALDMNKSRLHEGVVHLPHGVAVQALSLKSRPDNPYQLRVPAEDDLEAYLFDHKLTREAPEPTCDCTFHISPEGTIKLRFHHSLMNEMDGHPEPTVESGEFQLTDVFPVIESDQD